MCGRDSFQVGLSPNVYFLYYYHEFPAENSVCALGKEGKECQDSPRRASWVWAWDAASDSVAVESESDDDVSPPVTPGAPARKRVCLPVAAASQTSVRKPILDISDIGSVFQSEHQRWVVCPRNVSFKAKIEIVNNRWTPVKLFQYPVRVLNGKIEPSFHRGVIDSRG